MRKTMSLVFIIAILVVVPSGANATVFNQSGQVIRTGPAQQGADVGWWTGSSGSYIYDIPIMVGGIVGGSPVMNWMIGAYDATKVASMATQFLKAGTFLGSAALAGWLAYSGWQYINGVLNKLGGYSYAQGATGIGVAQLEYGGVKYNTLPVPCGTAQGSQGPWCCAPWGCGGYCANYGSNGWDPNKWQFSCNGPWHGSPQWTMDGCMAMPKAGYCGQVVQGYQVASDADVQTQFMSDVNAGVSSMRDMVKEMSASLSSALSTGNKSFPSPPGTYTDAKGNALTAAEADAVQTTANQGVPGAPSTPEPVDPGLTQSDITAGVQAALAAYGASTSAKQVDQAGMTIAMESALAAQGVVPGVFITPGQVEAAMIAALSSLSIPSGLTPAQAQSAVAAALAAQGVTPGAVAALTPLSQAAVQEAVRDGVIEAEEALDEPPSDNLTIPTPGDAEAPSYDRIGDRLDTFWEGLQALPIVGLLSGMNLVTGAGDPVVSFVLPGFLGGSGQTITVNLNQDSGPLGINYGYFLGLVGNLIFAFCALRWTMYLFEG